MKKTVALLLAIAMYFSLTACGEKQSAESSIPPTPTAKVPSAESEQPNSGLDAEQPTATPEPPSETDVPADPLPVETEIEDPEEDIQIPPPPTTEEAIAGSSEALSGQCGDELTWSLYENGTMVIRGTGVMWDFDSDDMDGHHRPPWDLLPTRTIILEEGVTTIGMNAFLSCPVNQLSIPSTLTTIGKWAFFGCTKLENILIPEGVTTIGLQAFAYTPVKRVMLPATLTTLDGAIFDSCSELTHISVAAENPYFCSEQGVLYSKDKTTLYEYPNNKSGSSYRVPDGVTAIAPLAFAGNCNLEHIELPTTLTDIGDSAFCECAALAEITIPEGITVIRNGTFTRCSVMTAVTIPDSVTQIEAWAFKACFAVKDIYYGGSEEAWGLCEIGSNNDPLESKETIMHYGR